MEKYTKDGIENIVAETENEIIKTYERLGI